jgi:hypothetical protein
LFGCGLGLLKKLLHKYKSLDEKSSFKLSFKGGMRLTIGHHETSQT